MTELVTSFTFSAGVISEEKITFSSLALWIVLSGFFLLSWCVSWRASVYEKKKLKKIIFDFIFILCNLTSRDEDGFDYLMFGFIGPPFLGGEEVFKFVHFECQGRDDFKKSKFPLMLFWSPKSGVSWVFSYRSTRKAHSGERFYTYFQTGSSPTSFAAFSKNKFNNWEEAFLFNI